MRVASRNLQIKKLRELEVIWELKVLDRFTQI